MRHNAEETIRQFSMLPKGSRVVVGFSGGADSAALLAFLLEKQQEWELRIEACHINHHLRGEEAQRDEDFCRRFCQERQVKLNVFQEDILGGAAKEGKSVEEYARQVRYERFAQLTPGDGDRIATAHNLNDLAETVVFRMIRGTGLRGLAGIPPVRGKIIRPLLYCGRQEIEAYCREKGIGFVTDSTNLQDDYSRNRIRHQLIPVMEDMNPAFLQSVRRLSCQTMEDEEFLERQAQELAVQLSTGENRWDRQGLRQAPASLGRRILIRWLRDWGCPYSQKKLEDMEKILEQGGTLEVCSGQYLEAKGETIRLFAKAEPQPYFETTLKMGENFLFQGKKMMISITEPEKYKNFANINEEGLKKALDYDKIKGLAVVRQRKPGDAIQLAGHRSPVTFKKLMNQRKLPIVERDRLAVICDENGPLWLEGFGGRADALPHEDTARLMIIRMTEE